VYAPIAQITMMTGADDRKGDAQDRRKKSTQVSTTISPAMFTEIHAGDQAPHEVRFFERTAAARAGSPDQKAPSSTAAVGDPGNPERDHRQERGGAGGVSRSFRRDDALDLAAAEIMAILGEAARRGHNS